MNIPDPILKVLKEYAAMELARNIHPEDSKVYARGLSDGQALLAQMLLENLEEEKEPNA